MGEPGGPAAPDRAADMLHPRLARFEAWNEPILTVPAFLRRVVLNFVASLVLIGVSLGIGMAGYHRFERMDWVDAFVNAAMILSGMGPLGELSTVEGKLFAGSYALYSGLVVVLSAGLILAPIAHRILHAFHLEDDDTPAEREPAPPRRARLPAHRRPHR